MKRSKSYRAAAEKIDRDLAYAPLEAIRLANEMRVPLVVLDPDGLWQAEWGTLVREPDETDA